MLHIEPVKAFKDNYLWVLYQSGSSEAVVVDPGDAAPVQAFLRKKGLRLAAILVTHHHADHIGGVDELVQHWQVPVHGPATPKIPMVTHPVREGDTVTVAGVAFRVMEVPGHTLEHVAYFADRADGGPLVFCGDTMFAAGCGRMFEGTPPMMQASLQKLAALPSATRVFCAHEYTLANLNFALAVLKDRPALLARINADQIRRRHDQPTVPSTMGLELATNPFLHWDDAAVRATLAAERDVHPQDAAETFGALRRWKDSF